MSKRPVPSPKAYETTKLVGLLSAVTSHATLPMIVSLNAGSTISNATTL